ncbi:MAG TPA: sugar phosphate isomerase/epimerase family protein [Candidatus Limnocylindria bacterium]|nr:sugar phosphate isomerase/epimerase family protein [Candidatus Limnocylindria bacterium]
MDIGVFSRTFRETGADAFRALRDSGLTRTHLNLLSCGMEPIPAKVSDGEVYRIGRLADEAGVALEGLSGTFNMIASDADEREEGIARFPVLCRIAAMLDIPMISLCTGSRNPRSRWEWDDRNLLPDAWEDLLKTTERILPLAEAAGVMLGVETEASNVVNTPERARAYLDHFKSPNIKIVMDAANLYPSGDVPDMNAVLDGAFALLGADVIQAHAKDLAAGPGLSFVAAGEGTIDFPHYIGLLKKYGFDGTVMLHSLEAEQVPKSAAFLRGVIARA